MTSWVATHQFPTPLYILDEQIDHSHWIYRGTHIGRLWDESKDVGLGDEYKEKDDDNSVEDLGDEFIDESAYVARSKALNTSLSDYPPRFGPCIALR